MLTKHKLLIPFPFSSPSVLRWRHSDWLMAEPCWAQKRCAIAWASSAGGSCLPLQGGFLLKPVPATQAPRPGLAAGIPSWKPFLAPGTAHRDFLFLLSWSYWIKCPQPTAAHKTHLCPHGSLIKATELYFSYSLGFSFWIKNNNNFQF